MRQLWVGDGFSSSDYLSLPYFRMLLIKGTPETKSEITNTHKFDVAGLIVLVVMLLSLNVVITKGAALGYTSLWFFGLIAIVIVAFFIFLKVEKK
ncbi:hypothetical protein ACVNPZ_02700 [Staphylococcus aureus]